MDTSEECDEEKASRYMQLIGVLRWAVELGRLDIYTEVALLSQQLALPRVGHLEVVYDVFAYLNRYDKSRITSDPTDPNARDTNYGEARLVFILSRRGRGAATDDARATREPGKHLCIC
jgi:hypothetical protein